MKVIWPIDVEHNDCPTCHSVLVTFDGEHCICPSCAAIEIERLRAEVERLRAEADSEVSEINAGFDAYKSGLPLESEPETKHDLWRVGYAFSAFDDLRAEVERLRAERLAWAEAGAKAMRDYLVIREKQDGPLSAYEIEESDPAAVARRAVDAEGG